MFASLPLPATTTYTVNSTTTATFTSATQDEIGAQDDI